MGGNNSKLNNWQGINFQNIQAAHTTQYQKNKSHHHKVRKWSKQTFFQRTHRWLTNMKKYSTLFITRETKIKTMMRYHLTLVRMDITKKSANNKFWKGCGEKGMLLHFWWECKLIQSLRKMVYRFLKKTRNKTTIWPSNPTFRCIPGGNHNWKRHTYLIAPWSSIYNS